MMLFCADKWVRRYAFCCFSFFVVFLFSVTFAAGEGVTGPKDNPDAKERCPVCGMFVAKYPNWLTRVELAGKGVKYFDGVKDLMAFYHNPALYGAGNASVNQVGVKDYYSLEWLDGKTAYYVVGSDVHGPMGHEFIPFSSLAAAENFSRDHKGKEILTFSEITASLVESMRSGQKMR